MRHVAHAARPRPPAAALRRTLRLLSRTLRLLSRTLRLLPHALPVLWGTLRALTGDDAYERYRLHHAAHHRCEPLMSRRAFCEDQLRRKWSGVSRCC
jgi:uncharacterized short protein YbdD (DUF466 family)